MSAATDILRDRSLTTCLWSARHLHEAVCALAQRAGLTSEHARVEPIPAEGRDEIERISSNTSHVKEDWLEQWFDASAIQLGVAITSVVTRHREVDALIRLAGPAILHIGNERDGEFLAVLRGGRRSLTIIDASLRTRRLSTEVVRATLTCPVEQAAVAPVRRALIETGIPAEHTRAAEQAIMREQLADEIIGRAWLVRCSPGSDLRTQVKHTRVPALLSLVLATHLISVLLFVGAWAIIGAEGIAEHFDRVAMWAWALLLLTAIPFQLVNAWAQHMLAMSVGGLFKKRLLSGILQLEPEEIRHQGAGQFLGVVMEAESLGSLALGGGLLSVFAVIELFIGVFILLAGAGGALHALLLIGWLALTAVLCHSYYHGTRKWVETYKDLTNDMVERMVGYRTRLAQESPHRWHDEESQLLSTYVAESELLDRKGVVIRGTLSRGWLLVGLASVLPKMVAAPQLTTAVAISVGGVVFVAQALNQLVAGLVNVVNAAVAWDQVGPLFQAATRSQARRNTPSMLPAAVKRMATTSEEPLISAEKLNFRYVMDAPPVLKNYDLIIHHGDRVLVQGPSGGGKSTLSAVLNGTCLPESGKLRLWGLDQRAIGIDGWRAQVVTAPQFHENYVFTETFAFNLLMGRGWPPRREDLREALTVCRELGLGDLLTRMPAGMQQMIGESGWKLSHGERSRLFIARALLQGAELLILDESFAALDPENLERAMRCVLTRAHTLVVIAHP